MFDFASFVTGSAASGFMRQSKALLRPDPMRTVLRPFEPGDVGGHHSGRPRAQRIADRVLAMPEADLEHLYRKTVDDLTSRHHDVLDVLRRRFEAVRNGLIDCHGAEGARALMIGAYFSEEFSFESAALFNPSVVAHPDQSGMSAGDLRILISLRGVGEGHVSSLTFRSGTWSRDGRIRLDPSSRWSVGPRLESRELAGAGRVDVADCTGSREITETVLFPFAASQGRGIEDVRLVEFVEEDGARDYRGTFTAFNGTDVREVMLRTSDFRHIEMRGVQGPWAMTKGMALFPRRVDGRFMMLGRQDNENIWLLTSDDMYTWTEAELLLEPRYPWEFVQLGNCGSPLEVEEGWIVLTHGVGDVRTYSMGACLLDRRDPRKVLARTPEPILEPLANERAGYVPNVVYSCGALIRDRTLLVPFGVADNFTGFGTISVDDLLRCMV